MKNIVGSGRTPGIGAGSTFNRDGSQEHQGMQLIMQLCIELGAQVTH